MRVLVVGRGSRSHALASQLVADGVGEVWCTPWAFPVDCYGIHPAPYRPAQHEQLAEWAVQQGVDLVVLTSEMEQIEGAACTLRSKGLNVFGASAAAARVECDRSFAKKFMKGQGIRTPACQCFASVAEARRQVASLAFPCYAKVVGCSIAASVELVESVAEADHWLEEVARLADRPVLFEECIYGEEFSVMAFCDGETAMLWPPVVEYKRALDGDRGSNTGGMGAHVDPRLMAEFDANECLAEVFEPVLKGLRARGTPYRGALTANLMVSEGRLWVLEFNCHIGDPEFSAMLPLLDGRIGELLWCAATGSLAQHEPTWLQLASACLTIASVGYPNDSALSPPIRARDLPRVEGVRFFSAVDGAFRGGRLLGLWETGPTLADARRRLYELGGKVLSSMLPEDQRRVYHRSDIGLIRS